MVLCCRTPFIVLCSLLWLGVLNGSLPEVPTNGSPVTESITVETDRSETTKNESSLLTPTEQSVSTGNGTSSVPATTTNDLITPTEQSVSAGNETTLAPETAANNLLTPTEKSVSTENETSLAPETTANHTSFTTGQPQIIQNETFSFNNSVSTTEKSNTSETTNSLTSTEKSRQSELPENESTSNPTITSTLNLNDTTTIDNWELAKSMGLKRNFTQEELDRLKVTPGFFSEPICVIKRGLWWPNLKMKPNETWISKKDCTVQYCYTDGTIRSYSCALLNSTLVQRHKGDPQITEALGKCRKAYCV